MPEILLVESIHRTLHIFGQMYFDIIHEIKPSDFTYGTEVVLGTMAHLSRGIETEVEEKKLQQSTPSSLLHVCVTKLLPCCQFGLWP